MSEAKTDLGNLLLTNIRFSLLSCHEPYRPAPSQQQPNPTPIYTADLLMAPDHACLKAVAAKIEAVGAAQQWKGGLTWAQVKEQLKGSDKLCLHKGDVTKAGRPEYAGLYYVRATNKRRITIVGPSREILTAQDGKPYSGSWGNATINIWAQDNPAGGKRINATLTGVQFLRDDEAFGGGPPPAEADEFPMAAASADSQPPGAEATDPTGGLL